MSKNKGHRPLLVTVLAVLFLISGAISVLGGIAAFSGLTLFGQVATGAAAGGAAMIAGVLNMIIGIGFLHGWSIMWIIGLVATVLELLGGFAGLLTGNFGVFMTMIVDVIILFYLMKPNVRRFFLG